MALVGLVCDGVQINDLHTFIKPHMAKLSPDPANVHFNGGGNGRLAGEVSKAILLALGMQPAEKE